MEPIQHHLCNDVLRKPAGMTDDECRDLHILRSDDAFGLNDGPTVNSFWKPDEIELEALNAGAPVVLHVCGSTHPPLSLLVLNPPDDEDLRKMLAKTKGQLTAALADNARLYEENKRLKEAALNR